MNEEGPKPSGRLWLLLPSIAIAIAVALVPCAGLLARKLPLWLAAVAVLALFPVLPLLWHVLAETGSGGVFAPASRTRLSLRILSIAFLALGVSLCDLGTQGILRTVSEGYSFLPLHSTPKVEKEPAPAPKPAPLPPMKTNAQHGLEAFIPADATAVVGLSGQAAIHRLLSAYGFDTPEKREAFATCKIDVDHALLLIAMRGGGGRMIVVRAQGMGDERSLYCLVGVLGSSPVRARFEGMGDSRVFLVQGILPTPLQFRLLDATTLGATDEAWRTAGDERVFVNGVPTQGRLAAPLRRLDRSAAFWSASVVDLPGGSWDLSLEGRIEQGRFRLLGTSVPPSGEADRADLDLHFPVTFAPSLPEELLSGGIRTMLSFVASTGESLSANAAALLGDAKLFPAERIHPPDAGR